MNVRVVICTIVLLLFIAPLNLLSAGEGFYFLNQMYTRPKPEISDPFEQMLSPQMPPEILLLLQSTGIDYSIRYEPKVTWRTFFNNRYHSYNSILVGHPALTKGIFTSSFELSYFMFTPSEKNVLSINRVSSDPIVIKMDYILDVSGKIFENFSFVMGTGLVFGSTMEIFNPFSSNGFVLPEVSLAVIPVVSMMSVITLGQKRAMRQQFSMAQKPVE
jgi:hypothetical protein